MVVEIGSVINTAADFVAKLNFASQQSSFPALRSLRIINESDDRLENLKITLTANPEFIKEKVWLLDRLEAKSSLSIEDRDLFIDSNFLLKLNDSMRGKLSLKIERAAECLLEQTFPIELLAHNEWGGAGYMPELLACFCTPNDPCIDKILKNASSILHRSGKKEGIEGYQSGSRERVWEISSAIYTAIANLNLSYCEPPASFELDGQKIRLPQILFDGLLGTCLDTALLFASAFEQAGLNPIIAMPKGHALVGVWLQPETLSSIVIDEAETLRKRVQLNELILIETTSVSRAHPPTFSQAIRSANTQLDATLDESFVAAVDIKRARMHRILPIGITAVKTDIDLEGHALQNSTSSFEEAPSLPTFDLAQDSAEVNETPQGRLDRWQRKLLDLTLRNPLLNHHATTTSLKIICPEPGLLEDKIAAGSKISVQTVPSMTNAVQDETTHRKRTGEKIAEEYAREALRNNQIIVDLPEKELSRRAVEIFRKAQTALQEGGANTLYLALGFLLWKKDEKDNRKFRAPLILLPVTLERQSVRSGIKLASHDDEPRFNTTLLEMLRKDFGIDLKGLDGELPTDESGIDVSGIWNKVRLSIKESPGFEVVEEVVLGHFSFAKYLMWKDLVDRTALLKENAVVKHLIDTPRDAFPSEVQFVKDSDIDKHFAPSDLFTTLPADGSQMSAVATADKGKDFVIIGPPGTGKSQTISNMIAHLLGKKKTILFVSEKTAALDVVHRRLEVCGLGKFCLQLHSNKARKLDVLNQLRACWEGAQKKKVTAWSVEAEQLRSHRDKLNLVVERLHKPYRNGMTPFHAMGVKVRDEDISNIITLVWPSANHHDVADLRVMREAVENLSIQANVIGDFSNSPFISIEHTEWSPQWENKIVDCARQLLIDSENLKANIKALQNTLQIELEIESFMQIEGLNELCTSLLDSYRKQSSYALESDGQERIEALERAVIVLKEYAAAQTSLSCSYEPMAWRNLDGTEIERKLEESKRTWILKRLFSEWSIKKQLKIGGALGKPNPAIDSKVLTKLRTLGEEIDHLDTVLKNFKNWHAHTTDPLLAEEIGSLGKRIRSALNKIAKNTESLIDLRQKTHSILKDGNDMLSVESTIGATANNFNLAFKSYKTRFDEFESLSGSSITALFGNRTNSFYQLVDHLETLIKGSRDLREWCIWRSRRKTALDFGLNPLVSGIEKGEIPLSQIAEIFEVAYCDWWSKAVVTEDDILRTFSSAEHTATISQFRKIDDNFQKLTSEYIAAVLNASIPQQEDIKRSSQWGTLQHEMRKKTRHKALRALTQEIPEVLTTLAPCIMMSPISVAQYLPADQKLFDVVIFDEASQITVWDAVGSIARGKQVIVAGDPKQMPPTNFFGRADTSDEDEINGEGDLESILEEMLGASIPARSLNLHYRSKRESLIAFSNLKYYDNSLITFPAPVVPDKGVRLVRPTGFYARGGARTNAGEAKAIADEIIKRITSSDEKVRKQSIGVVAMNSEQQTLIEDLLDEARSKNPNLEWAFSNEDTSEPIFIKNLESVQGDERDVIMFSITYGPDQSNYVTMNFGPLNRAGGERRLNVAITRARAEMVVFSTLRPEQIDLSRTNARAVQDLKHFLEYAEHGTQMLGAFDKGSLGDFESPFEVAVARALTEKGWIVHPQIGVSAFRIDLGILHPTLPGVYLAGVECDGAIYHSSMFARERDKIRQGVLEGLGWQLLRVWSTDWWTNKKKATDILHNKLTQLLAEWEHNGHIAKLSIDSSTLPKLRNATFETAETELKPISVIANSNVEITMDSENDYCTTTWENFPEPNQSVFYAPEYQKTLKKMIAHVVKTESPIHEDILIRRISKHHGFARSGAQIRDVILALARAEPAIKNMEKSCFYWATQHKSVRPRIAKRDEEMRNPEYICEEELKAINLVLNAQNDVTVIARALGISRLSKAAKELIEKALLP